MAHLENARARHPTGGLTAEPAKRNHNSRLSLPEPIMVLLVFILCLGAWEWLIYKKALSALFFPAPTTIAQTIVQLIKTGALSSHLGPTLSRQFLGFGLGGACGLLMGLAAGWFPQLRKIIDPFIAAAHPVPKIAVFPLIMIIFGLGEISKVVIIAIAAFFPMVINTMAGVRQIPSLYRDVAKNFGASPVKTFQRIVLPGSLPHIMVGTRLALNMALLLTIAVELVTAQKGLGALIWLAWETMRIEELYASLVVIALLGIGFNMMLQRIATYLVPWNESGNS